MIEPFRIQLSDGSEATVSSNENPIGKGGSCIVWPGVMVTTSNQKVDVAIKLAITDDQRQVEWLEAEMETLRVVSDHPNIVSYYGCEVSRHSNPYTVKLVMERMEMDLETLIFRNEEFRRSCKFADLTEIFVKMFTGLKYLHAKRILHYDMKCKNVLISKRQNTGKGKWDVKLTDFGVSKALSEGRDSITASWRGSEGYMSPEVVERALDLPGRRRGEKFAHPKALDVFSSGVVMWKCLNHSRVNCSGNERKKIGRTIEWPHMGKIGQIWCEAPPVYCDLVEDCLKKEPGERPTSAGVLSSLKAISEAKWVEDRVETFDDIPHEDSIPENIGACETVKIWSETSESGIAMDTASRTRSSDYQILRFNNGDIYTGPYFCSKKSGAGVYQFTNGSIYEGDFKDGSFEGHGVYSLSDGFLYEGEWANSIREGVGKETFAEGSTYRGEFSRGIRNGWGWMFRYCNGGSYVGNWKHGFMEGIGMKQGTDDSDYVGDFLADKRHGHGENRFPNGDRYLGGYERDMPHGYGVYIAAEGQKYEGRWRSGKKHGLFIYTTITGEQWAWKFVKGQDVWMQQLTNGEDMDESWPGKIYEKVYKFEAWAVRERAQKAYNEAVSRVVETYNISYDILERALEAAAKAGAARTRAIEAAMELDFTNMGL